MRRILLIFLLVGFAVFPVRAADKAEDFWHLTHFTNPDSKQFEYCATESDFDNGLSLAFARNRDFLTNIVIGFPAARLEEKTKYKMAITIDQNPPQPLIGFAADTKALVIPLQKNKKVLDWLHHGKLLTIKGPQDAVKFSLEGAGAALDQLQDCVQKNAKDALPSISLPGAARIAGVGQEDTGSSRSLLAENSQTAPSDTVEPLPLPKQSALPSPSSEPSSLPSIPEVMPAPVPTLPADTQVAAATPPAPEMPPAVVAQSPVANEPAAPAAPPVAPVAKREPVLASALDKPSPPSAPAPQQAETTPPGEVESNTVEIVNQSPNPVGESTGIPVPASPNAVLVPPPAPPAQMVQAPPAVEPPAPMVAQAPPVVLPMIQLIPEPNLPRQIIQAPVIPPSATPAPVSGPAAPQPAAAVTEAAAETSPAPQIVAPFPTPQSIQPVTAGLTQISLGTLLAQAGIKATVQSGPKPAKTGKHGQAAPSGQLTTYAWSKDGMTGLAVEKRDVHNAFLDNMMGDIDQLEKRCQGRFYSDIAAPDTHPSAATASVITQCTFANTAITTVTLYFQANHTYGFISLQGLPADRPNFIQTRDKIEIIFDTATNYK